MMQPVAFICPGSGGPDRMLHFLKESTGFDIIQSAEGPLKVIDDIFHVLYTY